MNLRYKSLFFDLDDTLWDTVCNNRECLEEIYVDYRFDRHYDSFEAFYDRYMLCNLSLWQRYRNHEIDRHTLIVERLLHVLRPMGIDDVEAALHINRDYLRRTTEKNRLVPGAVELLDALKPYYRMFILSNGFREIQSLKLQHAGLTTYFEKLILSEDACIQKPNRAIFDYALINTNSRRNESLMIGDSWEADIEGARHAGIDQLWFNPGRLPVKGFLPTYEVRFLSEVRTILQY
ncbi:MAG: YjjG family noncanonical pyrimidine nucleotidase [Tannerella sp.]|jgi:putative hydrolase of the HAD superfamily|nr:YjjG family noncanonical pyrimidine nucleotidase [Tannerella sp.]